MKLLPTRNNVENVKIQQLITLRTTIWGLTPNTHRHTHAHVISHHIKQKCDEVLSLISNQLWTDDRIICKWTGVMAVSVESDESESFAQVSSVSCDLWTMWTDRTKERQQTQTEVLPAGGQAVSHLTLAMLTEVLVIFRTRGKAVPKFLPVSRFEHSWKNKVCRVSKVSGIVSSEAAVFDDFQVSLTIDVRLGLWAAVLSVFIWKHRSRKICLAGFWSRKSCFAGGRAPLLGSLHEHKTLLAPPPGQMVTGILSDILALPLSSPSLQHHFASISVFIRPALLRSWLPWQRPTCLMSIFCCLRQEASRTWHGVS